MHAARKHDRERIIRGEKGKKARQGRQPQTLLVILILEISITAVYQ